MDRMRIVIVTQDDPFYLPLFFEHFFRFFGDIRDTVELAGVIIQKPLGQKTKHQLIIKMLHLYGPIGFLLQAARYAIDKAAARLNEMHILPKSFSISYFLRKNDIQLLKYKNVNSRKFIAFVENEKIDLIVSVAASQIFKSKILKKPRMGCINIHNAPLPDYRGMLPNFWQMYYGEDFSVMTIHEMVEEVDKGRIILQAKTKIEKGMTLSDLIKTTKRKNARELVDVLRIFAKGEVQFQDLPEGKGSYFSFPTKEDVSKFKQKGLRII